MTAQPITRPVQFDAAQIMGEIVAARMDWYLVTYECEIEAMTRAILELNKTDPDKARELSKRLIRCLT